MAEVGNLSPAAQAQVAEQLGLRSPAAAPAAAARDANVSILPETQAKIEEAEGTPPAEADEHFIEDMNLLDAVDLKLGNLAPIGILTLGKFGWLPDVCVCIMRKTDMRRFYGPVEDQSLVRRILRLLPE